FGSRYYSSDLSIWLSVDPMAAKYASLSPYNYCANNPVKLVDPEGEAWETPEDEIMANELKEKAMNKIDRINHQIDQLYQKKDHTNNDRKANNTQKIIDYLETQKSFLDEGIKTIDDMGSRKEYTFHFNETNNRHSNVTQRGGDNNGIIDINIFSEIRHETAWHEMVHIGDWLSGNSNYGFCDGLLGAFNDTKGIFEKHAYQSEFSFSNKRFLEFNINSLYKIDEYTYKKFENR
ncbi:MAG: hypothetical protein J5741_04135, partial [Bacteroidales bacterium]|nr:hypothetical protein [Bacteroidales bacterium]